MSIMQNSSNPDLIMACLPYQIWFASYLSRACLSSTSDSSSNLSMTCLPFRSKSNPDLNMACLSSRPYPTWLEHDLCHSDLPEWASVPAASQSQTVPHSCGGSASWPPPAAGHPDPGCLWPGVVASWAHLPRRRVPTRPQWQGGGRGGWHRLVLHPQQHPLQDWQEAYCKHTNPLPVGYFLGSFFLWWFESLLKCISQSVTTSQWLYCLLKRRVEKLSETDFALSVLYVCNLD